MISGICTKCGATRPKGQYYDLVIVLGAGYSMPLSGIQYAMDEYPAKSLLNLESKLRLDAGGLLVNSNNAHFIMTTAGNSIDPKWSMYPSLGKLGNRYLDEIYGIVSFAETESDATHGNLANGLRIAARSGIKIEKLAVVTSNYHLERARIMLEMMGVMADLVPAETVILRHKPDRAREIADWLFTVANTGIMANELAKISDPNYWERRRAFLSTPLDQEPEPVDITADVAATKARLTASGAKDTQTNAF